MYSGTVKQEQFEDAMFIEAQDKINKSGYDYKEEMLNLIEEGIDNEEHRNRIEAMYCEEYANACNLIYGER